MSQALSGNVSSKKILNILEDISVIPGIVNAIIVDKNDTVILLHGQQKRQFLLDMISFKLPLKINNQILGYLKLWPKPESILKWLFLNKNQHFLIGLFLFWWVLSIFGIYLYLDKNIFSPLKELKYFVDQIEKDKFTMLKLKTNHSIWQEISRKLNNINDKFAENSDTLRMLFSASKILTSSMEINEIFNTVLNIIQKKFESVSCSVLMLEDDGFLRIKNQRGISPDIVHNIRLNPGEDFAGKSFNECQPIIINDIAKKNSAVTLMLNEKEGLESFVFIPLVIDSKCEGLLNANSYEKNYFTPDKMKTLSTLAEYLSIGLCNARLYERIQEYNRRLGIEVSSTTRELIQTNSRLIQKAKEMKALSDILTASASKSSFSEILTVVVKNIKELLSVQACGFFLYSNDTEEMIPYPPFFGIQSQDFSSLRLKINDITVFKSIITENKSHIFNTMAKDALPFLSNIFDIQSLVLVPLSSGEKILGVIAVANKIEGAFGREDLRILELISDRISSIIENLKLYQELEHRVHDLTTLQEISSAISSEPELEKTLRTIVYTATKAFNADLCDLSLYKEDTRELISQPGGYFTVGQDAIETKVKVDDPNSFLAEVFREGSSFMSPDASIDPQIKNQVLRLLDIRSLILVLLKAENRVIGILRIGKHQANSYKKDHLILAELIAHQAAIIIENARLYDSLRDTKNELERLDRVKNEFISVISHEIKTPISAIKGFVKVVLNGNTGKLNSQQEKFLKIADQSIDRLITLVSELMDISQIESGKIKLNIRPVDAVELIHTVIENIPPAMFGKKIDISLELPENMPFVLADAKRLYQIFDNLMVNSIKFTPSGGKIVIHATDQGDHVLFGVKDTGIGIPEKDRKKVFDKFYRVESTVNKTVSGAGLGLAIVKSIIEIHGGNIWVDSEPKRGANFQFIIPVAKNTANKYNLGGK